MNVIYKPSSVDLGVPSVLLGFNMTGEGKRIFEKLRGKVDAFLNRDLVVSYHHEDTALPTDLINILDDIEEANSIVDQGTGVQILEELTILLRNELLSNKPYVVFNTVQLLDVCVKNCDFRIHVLIGRRYTLYLIIIPYTICPVPALLPYTSIP